MALTLPADTTRPHWLVRMNWKNRRAAFVLLALALGSHVLGQGSTPWIWVALVVQFLIYPHVLYLHGRFARQPRRAEVQNMLLDAVCFGAWAAVLEFSLWISFTLLVCASVHLMAFRGWRGGVETLLALALGIGAVACVQPLAFHSDTQLLTTLLCMLTLLVYLVVFAQETYLRSIQLHAQRSLLRVQLEEIVLLKDQFAEQAERDPLTGLFNRRMLEQHLPRLLVSSQMHHTTTVLLLLDMDFFKQANDRYGHVVGDQLLQALARHLQRYCRPQDMVFRYGGDEFLILFPDTTLEVAAARARELTEAFARAPRQLDQDSFYLTLSCGLAAYPEHASDAATLTQQADAALYQAKAHGRNCVVVHGVLPA